MPASKKQGSRDGPYGYISRWMGLFCTVVLLKLVSDSWMLFRDAPAPHEVMEHDGAPFQLVDSSEQRNVSYAYVIGSDQFGGRTNNELMAVLRALDMMFDKHGNAENCTAILVICGWARDMLKGFFFNETKHQEWAIRLEQVTPYMITRGRLGSLENKPQVIKNISGEDYFRYRSNPQHKNLSKYEMFKLRRNLILKPLFRNPSAGKMEGYYSLELHLKKMAAANDQLLPGKYMAVHSRWLEGSCRKRVGNVLPHDECTMNPGYIKRILKKLGLLGRMAVVVITDMQNEQVIARLKYDIEIGNHVVAPALDIKGWSIDTHPATDMMVAIHSHIFTGTRVSSMALMIGMARVAIGKDPQTNIVYVDKDLNVCEECLYYCNAKSTSLCGGG